MTLNQHGFICVVFGIILLSFLPSFCSAEDITAISPDSSGYITYTSYDNGYKANYDAVRTTSWEDYVNSTGSQTSFSGSQAGYAGQRGIVDIQSSFLDVYNIGYEYFAHYDLSDYDLSNYDSAHLIVNYQRPVLPFDPWASAQHIPLPLTLVANGQGSIGIGAGSVGGSESVPISLSDEINVQILTTSLKSQNPVPEGIPAETTTYEEYVAITTQIELISGSTQPNSPPVLDPIGNKEILAGETLEFTITASDPDGDALTFYATNLPLGASFNPSIQKFTWLPDATQAGVYENVLFEVMDNGTPPLSDSEAITITVDSLNQPPVAQFEVLQESPLIVGEIIVEENITFNASSSYDQDGVIVNYHWDFGDQTIVDGMVIKHHYSKPGDYLVTLTVEDNDGETNSTAQTVQIKPLPVILVHGWRGSPNNWNELIVELENNAIPYYVFDYSEDGATGNPIGYAQELEQEIGELCLNSEKIIGLGYNGGYSGKYDIICHSMGAMVTRWYMEEMGGSDSVRQWIGINPVNHGAALADKGDPLVPDWLGLFVHNLIGTKPAVKAMKTSSTEVETLNDNNLDNGVLYRVIVGINENEDASFSRIKLFGSIELGFGGKTIAMKFVDGKRKYWRTYLGDGVVALEQSQLAGKGIDCYEGLTHNTTTNNATVISRIIEYLKDPSKACMNNAPSTDSEFDLKFKAQEGNGGVLKKGMCLALYIPVGANINELEYTLTYLGSQLGMTIVSPSGQTLQENIDPVIGFYENENSIYYLISSPEEGIWSIRINAIDVPDAGEPYSLIAAIYNESDFPTDDVIAPATSILLEGTLENNCYSSSVNVTLISIDNTGGSGINNTQYSINGTPWSTYASPFTILDVGETTIYYFSTDNAGNVETEQEAVFRIANITNPLPGCTNPPQDLDNDGFYEDVNGDGVFSFGDIRLFFEYYDVWIPANEPIACFDYDGNGFIGFGDVRALFWMWGT